MLVATSYLFIVVNGAYDHNFFYRLQFFSVGVCAKPNSDLGLDRPNRWYMCLKRRIPVLILFILH